MKIVNSILIVVAYLLNIQAFNKGDMSILEYVLIDLVILFFGLNLGMWTFTKLQRISDK